jgi:HK97 gp10 family phage protein
VANRLRLRLTGFDELRHAVKAYGKHVVSDAVDAVSDAVEDTVAMARYQAPFKSGKLRDSISGTVRTDGYSITGTARATAPHAHLIEFGTARITKKPFLVPAAVRNRKRLNQDLVAAVVRRAPDGLGTPKISGEGPGTPGIGID